ncbi:hypothetical protein AB0L40_24265 [Patulibacter sp. NPDC049589]|uniref:hypothetical protein n=1 Tax=Patulibacter sp. NPDC049589 TaxID=3154731 RepID=UPI00341C0456
MARRAAPATEDVDPVLEPIRRAVQRRTEIDGVIAMAIRTAAEHDPRPTNRQIGAAAGLDESTVRAILHGRRS